MKQKLIFGLLFILTISMVSASSTPNCNSWGFLKPLCQEVVDYIDYKFDQCSMPTVENYYTSTTVKNNGGLDKQDVGRLMFNDSHYFDERSSAIDVFQNISASLVTRENYDYSLYNRITTEAKFRYDADIACSCN